MHVPSPAFAIYQNPSSAKDLIDASPITFELEVGKIASAYVTTGPDLSASVTDFTDDESVKQGEEHRTKAGSRASGTLPEAISSPPHGRIDKLAAAFAPIAEPISECNLPSQPSLSGQPPHVPTSNRPPLPTTQHPHQSQLPEPPCSNPRLSSESFISKSPIHKAITKSISSVRLTTAGSRWTPAPSWLRISRGECHWKEWCIAQ